MPPSLHLPTSSTSQKSTLHARRPPLPPSTPGGHPFLHARRRDLTCRRCQCALRLRPPSTPGGRSSLHALPPGSAPRPPSTSGGHPSLPLGVAPSPPLPAATTPSAAPQPSRVATSPAAAASALSFHALPPRPAAVPPSVALKIGNYAARNDAILLVIIPDLQAPDVASSRALRIARELDAEGTRTIGVLSKVDQAAGEQKALGAIQALLVNQGPRTAVDIQWVATIGHSVPIAFAQSGVGSETLPETSWQVEGESLLSILGGTPQSKLGRVALVDSLAKQIRTRIKVRLPNILNGLQGKSQIIQEELAKLGEQMVQSSEGTRVIALGLCREFEDKFLQHIAGGEGVGWKVVASFEGKFPTRVKQLPLDKHFDMKNVKRIVLEADGYQPYLISPEKGLRSLIKGLLELAKEPSTLLVDEVM